MTEAVLPISGYLDRFSHRPGETFTGYVSQRELGPYRITLERVVSGDPNPDGPGMRLDDLSNVLDLRADGVFQPIALGSYARIERTPSRGRMLAVTWTALVWPGDISDGQTIMHEQDEHRSVLLTVGESGTVAVVNGTISCATGAPMHRRRWYRIWVSVDPSSGTVLVGQQALDGSAPIVVATNAKDIALPSAGALLLAARDPDAPTAHFTGKLEDPAILRGLIRSWSDPTDPVEYGRECLIAW